MNGTGELIWSNGTKYIGEFKDDERHGQGVIEFPNGKIYKG